MPGGVWAQQVRSVSSGGYGMQAPRPASPFDAANQYLNGGGDPAVYGRGDTSVQKRQFADVGKYNLNLLDPLDESRAATNYQPVDGDGGLLGIGNYYNPMQPGGLFAGLFGGIAQTVGGVFGEGGAKTGSDIGTFLGKTLEMPLAVVGSAGVPFIAPVIDAMNSEVEKYTPYILRDTLKIPKDVGGAFQSMLNIFGLAGMAVERTYAGMDQRGSLPPDIEARVESGELTRDQAFDELVLTSRGYSNDVLHNLAWNLLLDPANWASLGVGAVGGAVKGTGTLARAFGATVRADAALAGKAIAQGGDIARVTKAALESESITGMVDSRGLMAQMRNVIDDGSSPFHLSYIERLGMSALGPVSAETGNVVAKVGGYILRATDPVNFFSGSKAGQRSMQFLTTAASTGAIAAYKAPVVLNLAKMADDIVGSGSERVYRSIGINGANAMQEHVLSDLATDAMKAGSIPRTGKLSPVEAVRELLRGGAYDSNIGKYIEVQVERNKDISVGMLPAQQMYDETVNKFASLLGVDSSRVRAVMKTVSSDDAILVHALYYYAKGEALHTGVVASLRAAKQAGRLTSEIDPERVAIISSRSLTNRSVKTVEDAMATGDVAAIRQAVEQFNDFNWVHNKNVPDLELKDTVQQWLDINKPHLLQEVDLIDPATGLPMPNVPRELLDWAQDGETFGYKLGQKMPGEVPEEALWRITRAPGKDGEILNANPYSDFWVEGGESAKRLNRFTATRMAMTRGVRQERIIWSQRRRFITDMAKGSADGGIDIPPALGDRIFKALMYEAKDRFIQPRGMEPREMYSTARRVLDDARKNNSAYDNLATKLTERQVVLTLLRATQGEVALVGVTQKVTGGIKAYAPGSGANYWGRISERLYPLMRFTLNPVFQTMEATEPYILNSMRGIWTPLRRDSGVYQEALATRNAISQLIHVSEDGDGIAAETAEALATQAYQGAQAEAKFGRGKIGRWMPHIGERKDVAAAMETERIMGDHLYVAFKEILGDRFEAFWADREREYGTVNRGRIAKRWMAANFALQDVNGFDVVVIDDILKMRSIGRRFRINKGGDRGAYGFSDVERVLDHVRSYDGSWSQGLRRERNLQPGEALLEDLKNMSREEWGEEIARSGLNTDGLTRISESAADDIWHAANGPELDEFWNGQYTVGGTRVEGYRGAYLQGITGSSAPWTRLARDQEIMHARAIVRAAAEAKGMTEEEFVKLHFEDIPRALQSLQDIEGGSLSEIREGWATEALRRGPDRPLAADAYEIALAGGADEIGGDHPLFQYLWDTEDSGDYVFQKMFRGNLSDYQDGLTGGSDYFYDLPNKGYFERGRLLQDSRPGDVIVRVRRDDVAVGDEWVPGVHLLDRSTVHPSKWEVLTPDGWKPMQGGRAGRVSPETNPRVTNVELKTGRDLFGYTNGSPDMVESGISKVDADQLLLDATEMNVRDDYTGSGYKVINQWHRGDETDWPITDKEANYITEHLDRAIAKGQLREPQTFYRGIDITNAQEEGQRMAIDYENLQVGDDFADDAYFSTSESPATASGFGALGQGWTSEDHVGAILTVETPAGTHMALVQSGSESEHLFGRKVRFTVTKKRVVRDSNGTVIHLTIVPTGREVKPGVNKLALGEASGRIRNEGRFLQEATSDPEALRSQVPKLGDRSPDGYPYTAEEIDGISQDIELAISKAEAAKPSGESVTIGNHTFGPRTPEQTLNEIIDTLDPLQIEIASRALPDLRARARMVMESEKWTSTGSGGNPYEVTDFNDTRLLAALAAATAHYGGFRFGLQRVMQVMESMWALGPGAVTAAGTPAIDREIATHLVRGLTYGIEQPILTNRGNDTLDAILGNTSRRQTGRIDFVQPIVADDLSAEAAGFLTESAYDDLVGQDLIYQGRPRRDTVPALDSAGKPGLRQALDTVAHGGPTVPQREFNDTVRDYLQDAGLQKRQKGPKMRAEGDPQYPEMYVGEPNGFQLVHHPRGFDRESGTANVWLAFAFDENGRAVSAVRLEGLPGADQPNYIAGVTNKSQGSQDPALRALEPEDVQERGGWTDTKGYTSRLYDWLQDQTDINMYPLTGVETTPQGHVFSKRWLGHRRALAEAGVAPTVAPTPPAAVIPTGQLEPTGARLGGSTGAKQVRDPDTGTLYVDKRGNSEGHIREESTTDRAYEAAGVPVAPHTLIDEPGGMPVKRAEMIEGGTSFSDFVETASPAEVDAVTKQLQQGFALDALLANWDVIGLVGDNVIVKDGVAYRIDNGGALRYRAQGELKGRFFGETVGELNTLRDPGMAEWGSRVFGDLTDAEIRRQVLDLGDKMDAILAALPPDLRDIVAARYQSMLDQTADMVPTPKAEAVAPATPALRPTKIGEYEHEYLVGFYNDLAKLANERGLGGRSTWTAADISMVAGHARQQLGRRGGRAVDDDEFTRAASTIHAAVLPGPGSELEKFTPLFDILSQRRYRAEKQRVMQGASRVLHQGLRDTLGLPVNRADELGVGLFDTGAAPLMSTTILSSPERLQSILDVIAYVTGQPVVRSFRGNFPVEDIEDFKAYTARASIVLAPNNMTAKQAEKLAEALGQRWPEAGNMVATRTDDGGWALSVMDDFDELFPRLDNGAVDEDRLHAFIEQMLQSEEFTDLDASLEVDYGHLAEAQPPRLEDGSIDWNGYARHIEEDAAQRGTAVSRADITSLRTAYNSELQHGLRQAAPTQYERLERGEPVHGRNLEDRRGGDILGVTSPRGVNAAVIRGFASSDALTGLHELIHVFSIASADTSMRDVVSKAFDEYNVANDAAKAAKVAVLQGRIATTTNAGVRTRLQNQIVALNHQLQTPHPTEWGQAQEEFFVHLVYDWMGRGVPDNPELANAFEHFRNWLTVTKRELNKPGMVPVQMSPAMETALSKMFKRKGVDTVSYSVEQQTMRMAGQQVLRSAWDEAHATHFYKRDRSMAERSINHPYIGLYPASYMWGKILPEMVRFLALRPFGMETPFLAWNVAREVSDSVRAQAELDPGFKDWLDGNEDAFMLFSMLFPGLPHDIPANASLPVRRIAEQGLESQKQYAMGVNPADVKDIDFARGSQDAIQYALGPLGTIRTFSEVAGMGGNLVRSTLGSAQEVFSGEKPPIETLPLR